MDRDGAIALLQKVNASPSSIIGVGWFSCAVVRIRPQAMEEACMDVRVFMKMKASVLLELTELMKG